MKEKRAIVNADDFGQDKETTEAILKAFKGGYLTDTTAMVTTDCFEESVKLAKENGISNKIGLHLDFFEGSPLSKEFKNTRFCKDDKFVDVLFLNKPLTKEEKFAFYMETVAQIRKLRGAGIEITHADSHHHIHNNIYVMRSVINALKDEGIKKIRITRNYGKMNPVKRILKGFYNLYIRLKGFTTTNYFCSLFDIENGLPNGITEIMVHPVFVEGNKLINAEEWFEDKEPTGSDFKVLEERLKNIERCSYIDL
jgi:predicted glycoside hydrolase/deacetylase ChbG (UPF0249 family)